MKHKPLVLLCALTLALIPAVLLSFSYGASGISPGVIARAIRAGDTQSAAYRIFLHVRLPRTLAAMLAGSALAVCGLVLQTVLNNPLASPSVLGINAGAGLGALLVMAFLPQAIAWVPAFAFAGAALAAAAVYCLATFTGASRSTIVLSGVAISSMLGAVMDTIVTLIPDAAVSRASFSIGGFASVDMRQLGFAFPFFIVGLGICVLRRQEMQLLALGDEVARGLGLRVAPARMLLLGAAAMLAGCAVSFAGLVSFVGLIVPHGTRLLLGREERFHLPVTMVLGALLCLVCDFIARSLFAPYELPVGVVLSFLGGPFFVYLLMRQRKRSNHHDAV